MIDQRYFGTERIVDPLFISPEALPLTDAEGNRGGAFGAKITQLIRDSNAAMGSLLAISALLASINPIISTIITGRHLATIVQLVISTLGSLCAVLGMVSMTLSRVMAMWDKANAAISLQGAQSARVTEKELTQGKTLVDAEANIWEDITSLGSSFGVNVPGVKNGTVTVSGSG